jgi:hypothetical protein
VLDRGLGFAKALVDVSQIEFEFGRGGERIGALEVFKRLLELTRSIGELPTLEVRASLLEGSLRRRFGLGLLGRVLSPGGNGDGRGDAERDAEPERPCKALIELILNPD